MIPQFLHPMDGTKACFVISPIGESGSPQRKAADAVLKHIFKPAIEPLGYAVVRADEISQPGSITLQVLERVLESALVIADLTDHNPNVFYELAVRHASEKPVIHVISSGQPIPFDVADMRTINIDTDLDGAERSRAEIAAQVREIEAGHSGQTPVKLAGVLKHLGSGKSDERLILKQILDGLTETRMEARQVQGLMVSQLKDVALQMEHQASPIRQRQPSIYLQQGGLLYLSEQLGLVLKAEGDVVKALNSKLVERDVVEYTLETGKGRKASIRVAPSIRAEQLTPILIGELRPAD
jgi:hypothetical protein